MKETLRLTAILLTAAAIVVVMHGNATLCAQDLSLDERAPVALHFPNEPAANASAMLEPQAVGKPLILEPLPSVADSNSATTPVAGQPAALASPVVAQPLTADASAAEKDSAEKTATSLMLDGKASPLEMSSRPQIRSEQMEQLARQADHQTRHGLELAGRRAFFAARAEFLSSLKLIAEGLDTDEKTDVHGRALAAGLTAMREADDFMPRGAMADVDQEVTGLIASHTTPVLKAEVKNTQNKITAMAAAQRYMTYAQQQFALAAGHEVAGAVALQSLGKLHLAMAKKKIALITAPEPKAVVFFQASLVVDRRNYMAANDLGVLLAQSGNYAAARGMLQYSLAVSQQSATWHNLAVVYRQMNMTVQSGQAEQQAVALQRMEIARRRQITGTSAENVAWTDAKTFADTSASAPDAFGASQPAAVAKNNTTSSTPAQPNAAGRPSTAERTSWTTNGQR